MKLQTMTELVAKIATWQKNFNKQVFYEMHLRNGAGFCSDCPFLKRDKFDFCYECPSRRFKKLYKKK